jgi:hypothetical protein
MILFRQFADNLRSKSWMGKFGKEYMGWMLRAGYLVKSGSTSGKVRSLVFVWEEGEGGKI